MTRLEIVQRLAELLPNLREQYPLGQVKLFGSYSRGEQTELSDVDLVVEFIGPIRYRELIALEDELTAALGTRVDLSDNNGLRPRVRERVQQEAIAI